VPLQLQYPWRPVEFGQPSHDNSSIRSTLMSRYDSLTGHLLQHTEPVVTIKFAELDEVVGRLPASAGDTIENL
jgi:hypothetical protein